MLQAADRPVTYAKARLQSSACAKIVVTQAMIEAGMRALDEELIAGEVVTAMRDLLCQRVYEAMSRAGERPPDEWRQLFVYLDGSPLKGAIEANADEGWAVVVVTDAQGRVLRNEAGDGFRTMRLTELKGRISIAPGEAESPATAAPEATRGDDAGR